METYIEPHFDKSALITIDMQNDFTLDNAPAQITGTADVVDNVTRLIDLYRENKRPVVHMIRLYRRDGSNVDLCRRKVVEDGTAIAAPGSDGAELVTDMKPNPSITLETDELLAGNAQQIGDDEFILYKPRWGAFYGTTLEQFLKQRGVDTLVFSGCNFPNCPRTSIYEASERNFALCW